MSNVATSFAAAAETIEQALGQLVDRVADVRGSARDHDMQLGAMNISVLAVRQEVLERLDTLETKVLTELATVNAKLDSIAAAIAGGAHV